MTTGVIMERMAKMLHYDLEADDDSMREELELYAQQAQELARHYTNKDELPEELCPCVSKLAVNLMQDDAYSYIRLGDLTVQGGESTDELMRELHRFRALHW